MRLAKRLITERFIDKYVLNHCESKTVYPTFTLYKMNSGEIRHWVTGSVTFKGNLHDYELAYSCMVTVNKNHRIGEYPF